MIYQDHTTPHSLARPGRASTLLRPHLTMQVQATACLSVACRTISPHDIALPRTHTTQTPLPVFLFVCIVHSHADDSSPQLHSTRHSALVRSTTTVLCPCTHMLRKAPCHRTSSRNRNAHPCQLYAAETSQTHQAS